MCQVLVRRVNLEDDPKIIAAPISRSFYDYVIPLRAFAHSPGRMEDWIHRLMEESVVRRRVSSVVFTAEVDSVPVGAAILRSPQADQSPEAEAMLDRFMDDAGPECAAFFEAFFQSMDGFGFPEPHVYLGMLGVDPPFQGKGIGRALVKAVSDYAATVPGCQGVCLDTESEANVSIYERMGFRVIGNSHFDGVDVWGLHLPPGVL